MKPTLSRFYYQCPNYGCMAKFRENMDKCPICGAFPLNNINIRKDKPTLSSKWGKVKFNKALKFLGLSMSGSQKNKFMNSTLSSKWEIEFDKKYVGKVGWIMVGEVKNIIKETLASHHKQLLSQIEGEVEKNKWTNKDAENFWHELGDTTNPFSDMKECYNQALFDVLSILKKI